MNIKPTVIFGIVAFVGIFLAGLCLQLSGLTTVDLLSFSINDKIGKIFSLAFAGFLIFLPIGGGLISAAPGILNRKQALTSVLVGTLVGMVFLGIIFPKLAGFMWPGLFLLVGSALAIQLVYMKKKELKSFVGARLAFSSVQRRMMLVALGLAVWGMITILPQQEVFNQNFENSLLNMALPTGDESISVNSALVDGMIDLSVNSQQQLLQQIMQLPQFESIQSSQDIEDQEFVQAMVLLEQGINVPVYKEQVKTMIQARLEQNPISGEELLGTVKERIPIISTIENWLWLIFSVGIASIFLFLSGIILQPIGMFWGVVFQKTIKRTVKGEETKKIVPPEIETTTPENSSFEAAESGKSPFEIKSSETQKEQAEKELFPPGEL